jgi:glycosyltransferase 2 family protein
MWVSSVAGTGMDTTEGGKFPKWIVPVIGYGIAALSLIWVFSHFPFAELGRHLRTMDWWWIGVAVGVEIGVYFIDAWRWMILLRPVGAPSFGCCLQAVFVGLFANDVLPARAGEVIRCFLLSFKTEVPISLALTSDFIQRIMDGMWIVAIYAVVTWQISTHVAVNRVMWFFGGVVVFIALVLLWVLFHRQHAHGVFSKSKLGMKFVHFFDEIHRLGNWRELGTAMAISGLYWAAQIFAVWSIARADSFYFGGAEMAFLLVVKTVGTLIPNAPANVGAYQATTVYALERLFTEPADAKILAQIMFGFLTLPLVLGGAIAITLAGFNLNDLHRHAHEAHKTHKLKRAKRGSA